MGEELRNLKFIHLHFANHIMVRNTAEIMGSDKTDPTVYNEIVEFAKSIAMLPVELKKEKSGYFFGKAAWALWNL